MRNNQQQSDWFWTVIIFLSGILLLPCMYCRAESVKLEVTGYCVCKRCCGPSAKGITASGKRARPNVTIAAPRSFQFGSRVRVPGWGTGIVEDRGGMIRSKGQRLEHGRIAAYDRIDLCFATHAEALRWGRRTVTCEVTHASPQKEKPSRRTDRDSRRKQ